jgi:hypothetical protein
VKNRFYEARSNIQANLGGQYPQQLPYPEDQMGGMGMQGMQGMQGPPGMGPGGPQQ